MKLNRRSTNSGVDAFKTFENMAKFHRVKRSEREAWMPNWPFNMDVICFRRAHRDAYFEIKSRRVLDASAHKPAAGN